MSNFDYFGLGYFVGVVVTILGSIIYEKLKARKLIK